MGREIIFRAFKKLEKDHLLSLINYLTETVQIVRLVVHGDESAYTIFETLNDRGMDLAPLDLVKNYLFSRAEKSQSGSKNKLRDLEDRWTEMMTLLSVVKADSFLRAFWASKHGAPEGRKLFGPFKRQYADPAAAYKVSIEMRGAAELYVGLMDSSDAIWSEYSPKSKRSVDALNIIGVTQRDAVERQHNCTARLMQSVPVSESFGGNAVWEGVVHVFDISGHPKAKQAYAWSLPIDGSDKRRFFAVLHLPPVTSPADAVRAAIVTESRSRQ